MAAFTDRKQALHDKLASTLVIYASGTVSSAPFAQQVAPYSSGSTGSSSAYTTVRQSSSKQVVLAGFDSTGRVVRLSFDKDDSRLHQGGLMIGRDGQVVQLHVNDTSVSRMHAKIYSQSGELMIEDLKSTNGTIVNGRRLASGSAATLPDRGNLMIGDVELSIGEF